MNAQFTQWLEMNRSAMAPLLRWNELTAQTTEKMARENVSAMQDLMELGSRHLQLAGELKDPKAWLLEESKLMTEYSQKVAARAGGYLELSKELRESVLSWVDTTVKTTTETFTPKEP